VRRHGLPCARNRLDPAWSDSESFVARSGSRCAQASDCMGCTRPGGSHLSTNLRAALRCLHAVPTIQRSPMKFFVAESSASDITSAAGPIRVVLALLPDAARLRHAVLQGRRIPASDRRTRLRRTRALGVRAGLGSGPRHRLHPL